MKRAVAYVVFVLAISISAAVAGKVNGQQDDKPKDQNGVQQGDKPKVKFRKVEADAIPGQYIVGLVEDVKIEDIEKVADELIAKYGGSINIDNEIVMETKQADGSLKKEVVRPGRKAVYKKKSLKGFHALMTEEQAKALSEDPKVEYVKEVGVSKPTGGLSVPAGTLAPDRIKPKTNPQDNLNLEPNSPATDQVGVDYTLDRIDTVSRVYNNTYKYYTSGSGVRLYLIDTGINLAHQEFKIGDTIVHIVPPETNPDCNGHGTAVASLAAGKNLGVAKLAKIIMLRVSRSCSGLSSDPDILRALDFVESDSQANRPTPSVLNMSVIRHDPSHQAVDLENTVLELIRDFNVPVVAAAGQTTNGTIAGRQQDWLYGRVGGTTTVGMTDSLDRKVDRLTNVIDTAYGSFIDLFAPGGPNFNFNPATGVLVANAQTVSGYVRNGIGTSAAAPLVAGVTAQYLENNWFARAAQPKQAILDFTTKNLLTGLRQDVGGGNPDPNKLLYEPFAMPACVNAASFARGTAPDSLASLFVQFNIFPGNFIKIGDSGFLPITQVTPIQANFYVPALTTPGTVPTVKFYATATESSYIGNGTIVINSLAAGLFTVNGSGTGLASGQLLRVNKANPSQQIYETLTAEGNIINTTTEDNYLILYGTGFRAASSFTVQFDGINIPVTFAGAQGSPGLDQVNAGPLGENLRGRINKDVRLTANGQIANIVKASFR